MSRFFDISKPDDLVFHTSRFEFPLVGGRADMRIIFANPVELSSMCKASRTNIPTWHMHMGPAGGMARRAFSSPTAVWRDAWPADRAEIGAKN